MIRILMQYIVERYVYACHRSLTRLLACLLACLLCTRASLMFIESKNGDIIAARDQPGS